MRGCGGRDHVASSIIQLHEGVFENLQLPTELGANKRLLFQRRRRSFNVFKAREARRSYRQVEEPKGCAYLKGGCHPKRLKAVTQLLGAVTQTITGNPLT